MAQGEVINGDGLSGAVKEIRESMRKFSEAFAASLDTLQRRIERLESGDTHQNVKPCAMPPAAVPPAAEATEDSRPPLLTTEPWREELPGQTSISAAAVDHTPEATSIDARGQADQLARRVCNRLVQQKNSHHRRTRLLALASAAIVVCLSIGAGCLLVWIKS
jgi:hypothetical protein